MSLKPYHIWIDDYIDGSVDKFTGQPNGISVKYVRQHIEKAMADGADKIILHINSGGGSVFEGFGIYNVLTGCGLPIESRIISLSASIATLIMLAGEENSIIMSPTSQLMFHKPSVQTHGNSDDHEKSVEELKKIEDIMAERYAHKMGTSIEEGHSLMSKGNYFINPKDALALKMVDIIEVPKMAMVQDNLIINKMKNYKFTQNGQQIFNKILAMFAEAAEPTAGMIKLADGSTIIYFEGDTIETGKAVWINAEMTEKAPVGEHALEDGRLMVVDEAGVCVELREVEVFASAEDLAAANEKVAQLEAENASLKAEKEAAIATASAKTTRLSEIEKQFTALKAQIVSSDSGVDGEHGNGGNAVVSKATKTIGMKESVEKLKNKLKAAKEGKL